MQSWGTRYNVAMYACMYVYHMLIWRWTAIFSFFSLLQEESSGCLVIWDCCWSFEDQKTRRGCGLEIGFNLILVNKNVVYLNNFVHHCLSSAQNSWYIWAYLLLFVHFILLWNNNKEKTPISVHCMWHKWLTTDINKGELPCWG